MKHPWADKNSDTNHLKDWQNNKAGKIIEDEKGRLNRRDGLYCNQAGHYY